MNQRIYKFIEGLLHQALILLDSSLVNWFCLIPVYHRNIQVYGLR